MAKHCVLLSSNPQVKKKLNFHIYEYYCLMYWWIGIAIQHCEQRRNLSLSLSFFNKKGSLFAAHPVFPADGRPRPYTTKTNTIPKELYTHIHTKPDRIWESEREKRRETSFLPRLQQSSEGQTITLSERTLYNAKVYFSSFFCFGIRKKM